MKKILILTLTLFLAACSFTGTNELAGNQTKWNNSNITHYRYSLSIGCFCAFRNEMPLTVEVNNGEVVSMTRPDGTIVKPTDPGNDSFTAYSTIDRVFSQLKADLGGKADEVTVTYDPTYGFPNSINIDYIKDAVDDEVSVQIENFEILK